MLRFFLVFFLTLLIGFFSPVLSLAVNALLFFGKHALLSSPERVPYVVPQVLAVVVTFLPPLVFIRWHARKKGPAWISWAAGLPGLAVGNLLYWFLVSFGGAG